MPRVGVVFVNYHSEALVVPRAGTLASAGFHVVVVDNSGTYPVGPGTVVQSGGNIGFGAGCNLALGSIPEEVDVVVLHNPDVDAPVATLEALATVVRAEPSLGLLAPAVDIGRDIRSHGYRYPAARREAVLGIAACLRRWPSVPRPLRRRSALPVGFAVCPAPSDRFGTAALLVARRDALKAVGGFDELFFLYAEDLDLWHRVRSAGFAVGYLPSAVVHHERGSGSPATRDSREVLRWIGVEYAAEKHGWGWRSMRAAHRLPLECLARRGVPVAREVQPAWRIGAPPSEVMRLVTGLLRRGRVPLSA